MNRRALTYPDALAYVLSLQAKGWRMGLDRIEELLRRIDDLRLTIYDWPTARKETTLPPPDRQPSTVNRQPSFLHVAGTNGKGSVTQYVQSILHEAGYLVGGYYSPYVYEPRERIQFGRDLISEAEYASVVEELMPIAESMATPEFDGGVSKFEFETAMGLLYWQRKACDYVALEVGMGGRLDATNVVIPAVSVIVSIGLDHTQYLGTTHEEVAREKAGIVKPGVPVICGAIPEPGLVEIEKIATERQAQIWCFGQEIRPMPGPDGRWSIQTPAGNREGLTPGMAGISQPHNLALAVAAIEAAGIKVSDEAMRLGAERARLPGRFERRTILVSPRLPIPQDELTPPRPRGGSPDNEQSTINPSRGRGGVSSGMGSGVDAESMEVILDGAHNTEAAKVLVRNVQRAFPQRKVVLLTGMVEGHDPLPFYQALQPVLDSAHVAPIDFHRAQNPETIAKALEAVGVPAEAHAKREAALGAALQEAGERGLPLLVTGSFYLLGEIGPLLGPDGAQASRYDLGAC